MRYAAKNQTTDFLSRYRDFMPLESFIGAPVGDPVQSFQLIGGGRYSDEQLYALALYIYSLTPPPNPNKSDGGPRAGEQVFEREGCARTATRRRSTRTTSSRRRRGSRPPEEPAKYDIMPDCRRHRPGLAMKTRRGTGYYKVPSLKGVWYRGPFEHNGSVATLEDWFDERRIREDYVPTGFKATA